MAWTVVYKKAALRALERMPRDQRQLITAKVGLLAEVPHGDQPNVRKLVGEPGFRLRVGDWRIVYVLEDNRMTIVVIKIGSRGSVYR